MIAGALSGIGLTYLAGRIDRWRGRRALARRLAHDRAVIAAVRRPADQP